MEIHDKWKADDKGDRRLQEAKKFLRPRMSLVVYSLQPLSCHMRIYRSGRKVRMAEELLDAAEIRAAIEEVRRE